MLAKTLIRLDASAYQKNSYFLREKELAELHGMNYLYLDARHQGVSLPLPAGYEGPYILVSNTHTQFNELPQELYDQTVLLIHANSGYDNFKGSHFQKWSFPIILGNPVRAPAVVEYVLGHLFERFAFHVHQSHWSPGRHWERPLLAEQNILILGQGMIGKKLSEVLRPMCKTLTTFDPYKENERGKILGHSFKEELHETLPHKDVILFACGLNGRNRHMISKEELNLLNNDKVLLINPARGSLIKESDLIEFLRDHPKSYAVCDVFEKEPFKDQFTGLTNIHLTSHIAGVSSHLEDHLISFVAKVLEDFKSEDCDLNFEKNYAHLNLKERLIDGVLI